MSSAGAWNHWHFKRWPTLGMRHLIHALKEHHSKTRMDLVADYQKTDAFERSAKVFELLISYRDVILYNYIYLDEITQHLVPNIEVPKGTK